MDFAIIQEYVLPHWPFIVMMVLLACTGRVMKEHVWTKEKASQKRFCWWMRAFLPMHAPLTGAVVAGLAEFVGGFPTSPGVEGPVAAMLYYAGAGWASTWVYALIKHFAKARGISLERRASMPQKPKAKPFRYYMEDK